MKSPAGHDGDVAYSVVFEFDAVDEAEVIDVDRYFGVKDGLEHAKYLFFFFQKLVHSL